MNGGETLRLAQPGYSRSWSNLAVTFRPSA